MTYKLISIFWRILSIINTYFRYTENNANEKPRNIPKRKMDRSSKSRESGRPSSSRTQGKAERRPGMQVRPSPVMLDTGRRGSSQFQSPAVMLDTERRHPPARPRSSPAIDRELSSTGREERPSEQIQNTNQNNRGNHSLQPQPSRASAASAPSCFRSSVDQKMASRQTHIETLPPIERQEQEEWAQRQLKGIEGACVAGFSWYRIQGGYQCHGGHHLVTDELLAEGQGGYYEGSGVDMMNPFWEGPFYGSDPFQYFVKGGPKRGLVT